MLDKYSPEQLKVIIQNLAPSGLLEWAEELDRDLTDPSIRMRYRNHLDGLADFFWRHQYIVNFSEFLLEIISSRLCQVYSLPE